MLVVSGSAPRRYAGAVLVVGRGNAALGSGPSGRAFPLAVAMPLVAATLPMAGVGFAGLTVLAFSGSSLARLPLRIGPLVVALRALHYHRRIS